MKKWRTTVIEVLYAPKLTLRFVPAAAASRVKILITFVHFPHNGTVSTTNVDLELVARAQCLEGLWPFAWNKSRTECDFDERTSIRYWQVVSRDTLLLVSLSQAWLPLFCPEDYFRVIGISLTLSKLLYEFFLLRQMMICSISHV